MFLMFVEEKSPKSSSNICCLIYVLFCLDISLVAWLLAVSAWSTFLTGQDDLARTARHHLELMIRYASVLDNT